MRSNRSLIGLAVAVLCLCSVSPAWHAPGHRRTTVLAVKGLPADMPAFFAEGINTISHCACDPDFFRTPFAEAELTAAERPEHYFDVEWLDGEPIPPDRAAMLKWCADHDVDVAAVGLLPYAVTEWTQRLTVAFAEHRRYPDNAAIQAKCLVYAGLLAHYAQDLCQPLHTTIHYDGCVGVDGESPKTGIHTKIDALIGKLPAARAADMPRRIEAFEDLFQGVVEELYVSHQLVDTVYSLQADLPDEEVPLAPDGKAEAFARQRRIAAARFTARLYVTAWANSADLTFPDWYARPPTWTAADQGSILVIEATDGP